MPLTAAQKDTIKQDILNTPAALAILQEGNTVALAAFYNTIASPDYWAWRTSVSRAEIYNDVDHEGNSWSWQTFKAQNATEQTAWIQMFMGDAADFSKDNLRAGVANIFSGSAAANAQQAHILSVGRKKATRAEKVFATGAGTTAAPSKLGFVGNVIPQDFAGMTA